MRGPPDIRNQNRFWLIAHLIPALSSNVYEYHDYPPLNEFAVYGSTCLFRHRFANANRLFVCDGEKTESQHFPV